MVITKDMETQIQTADDEEGGDGQQLVESLDSIQSFGNEPSGGQDDDDIDVDMATPKAKPRTRSSRKSFEEEKEKSNANKIDLNVEEVDNGSNCDCGVLVRVSSIF